MQVSIHALSHIPTCDCTEKHLVLSLPDQLLLILTTPYKINNFTEREGECGLEEIVYNRSIGTGTQYHPIIFCFFFTYWWSTIAFLVHIRIRLHYTVVRLLLLSSQGYLGLQVCRSTWLDMIQSCGYL